MPFLQGTSCCILKRLQQVCHLPHCLQQSPRQPLQPLLCLQPKLFIHCCAEKVALAAGDRCVQAKMPAGSTFFGLPSQHNEACWPAPVQPSLHHHLDMGCLIAQAAASRQWQNPLPPPPPTAVWPLQVAQTACYIAGAEM